jgi:hypothetical protein
MELPSYPLYDMLIQKEHIDTDDETPLLPHEKRSLCVSFSHLQPCARNYAYLLIKEDERRFAERQMIRAIPYNGKQLAKGVQFDLEKFPARLQRILRAFVEMDEETGALSDNDARQHGNAPRVQSALSKRQKRGKK